MSVLDHDAPEAVPAVVSRRPITLSRWVTVTERAVAAGSGAAELFHSLSLADYVTVLARTEDGMIVLVRQFRPVWETFTLELPGGMLDPGEDPATCAARELVEETGFRPGRPLQPLGRLKTDTGRLENHLWGFFADAVRPLPDWCPEAGVERILVPVDDFLEMVREETFDHALHVALVGMALLRGCLR